MAVRTKETRKRVRLDYDERRGLILESARRLFCAHPYESVSMADIAAAAGVARGLLNHYFGSKRDLYLEVVRQVIELPTQPPLQSHLGLDERQVWEANVDGWMDLIEHNRELWLTVIGAGSIGRDPELEGVLDETREIVAKRALQSLGIDPTTASPQVVAITRGYGGLAEVTSREWLDRGRLTRAEAREVLVQVLPALLAHHLPALATTSTPD